MPDIFVSYNREDQAVARRFAEAFQAEGLDVWWDVTLRSGEAYDEVTETALRTAKAVVVLWSNKSVVSRWVRAEATLADRNKTLVPAMIEPCERPIMFELTQTAELSHWQGAPEDRAWQAFLSDVKRLVSKDVAPVVPAQPAVARGAPAKVFLDGLASLLTPVMGPIAPHLIQREASSSSSNDDLIRRLAERIPAAADRETFLAAARRLAE